MNIEYNNFWYLLQARNKDFVEVVWDSLNLKVYLFLKMSQLGAVLNKGV